MTSAMIFSEVGHVDIGFDVTDGATHVGGDQVQDLFGHGREAANAQLVIDDDDGDLHAAQQVDQVAVGPAQLLVAAVQFLVDGVEFLVGGLQFLAGGVQLFIGALQLLVAGEDLLIGGLELLVGGFEFLDDGLEVFAAGGQFVLELLGAGVALALGPAFGWAPGRAGHGLRGVVKGGRDLLEEDQEVAAFGGGAEGDDFQVHIMDSTILADMEAIAARGLVGFACFVDGGAQAVEQPFASHFQHAEAGVAGGINS